MDCSLRGFLLAASPRLSDPHFERTVILIVQHDQRGAIGVVLNRSASIDAHELWEAASKTLAGSVTADIRCGGPVNGPILAVGRNPALGIMRMTSDFSLLQATGQNENQDEDRNGGEVESSDVQVFIGCAGWNDGQLESEIQQGDWFVIPARDEHVFGDDLDLWRTVVQEVGSRVLEGLGIRDIPSDPLLN